MTRLAWKTCRWPLILFCLWMVTLTGIHSIPVEDHEVLVVQTTREMEIRDDWILPSFNDEPRLQKPPFNYWATAALSFLDPSSPDAQVWHGRLISLLAGFAMALATYHAGKTFFGPVVGKLASLMLMSMQGYINLTQSARPDFLYSMLGSLQLFAWMYAWKAEDGTARQRLFGWLGWGLAGLATLTKGPQLPFVFLAGMLTFLLSGPDRKRTLEVLRPFSGIAIFCALVLPWWLLLQQRVEQIALDLSRTQMSGSLLKNLASWKEILSFYYPFTLFVLMIPASLLIPFLVRPLWRRRGGEVGRPTLLLVHASVALLIVFTLGGHYRKHYLLPLLPVFSLFLACALQAVPFRALAGTAKRTLLVLLGALAALCLALMLREGAYVGLAWMALNAAALAILFRKELEEWAPERFSTQWLKATAALVVIVTGYMTYFPSPQERWRDSVQDFAESIGGKLRPSDRMVQWESDSPILLLYARRPVPRFDEPDPLEAYLWKQGGGDVYAVVPRQKLAVFTSRFKNRILAIVENRRHPEKDLAFVKIDRTARGGGS